MASRSHEEEEQAHRRGSIFSSFTLPTLPHERRNQSLRQERKSSGIAKLRRWETNAIAPIWEYRGSKEKGMQVCDISNGFDFEKHLTVPRPCTVILAAEKTNQKDPSWDAVAVTNRKHSTRGSSPHGEMPADTFHVYICSICLETFLDGDTVRETPCHHVFHARCLEWWLERYRARCPLDQVDLKKVLDEQTT